MSRPSIRVRLTAVAVAVSVVVLMVASAALVLAFTRAQVLAADDLARARLAELGSAAEDGRVDRLLTQVGDDGFAQVVIGDRVLGASPSLGQSGPVSGWRPAVGDTEVRDLDSVPDDDETEHYRVWASTVTGPDGEVTVYVGTARELVAESARRLSASLAVGLPPLIVVSAWLLWLLLGRVLRPVHESQRRQQAFVADAAHELQSPLASYRAQLEVALRRGDDEGWQDTVRDLLADCDRMERLVRDLLFLAREEAPGPPSRALVDLDDVVLEEAARLRPTTSVILDVTGVTAAPVRGSRGDLGRLVRNLLANAARHASSRVEVSCAAGPDGVVRLTVLDDGPGIAPELHERVFERFFRADAARSESGSTGLGLSIVRAVAERHGGSVSVGDSPAGARIDATLPGA